LKKDETMLLRIEDTKTWNPFALGELFSLQVLSKKEFLSFSTFSVAKPISTSRFAV